jgi:hypothetical protein
MVVLATTVADDVASNCKANFLVALSVMFFFFWYILVSIVVLLDEGHT